MSEKTVDYYKKHMETQKGRLPCTPFVVDFPITQWEHWRTRIYLERLELKMEPIHMRLIALENDWEAVFFERIARSFGLNRNGDAFEAMSQSFPFSLVRKLQPSALDLEALFMGQARMLITMPQADCYGKELRARYQFIRNKYALKPVAGQAVQYTRLRPTNFPTIRLSQLAQLYHNCNAVFEKIKSLNDLEGLHIFKHIGVSPHWQSHFSFTSQQFPQRKNQKRRLTINFRQLLIINAIIPVLYAYGNWIGVDRSEWLFRQLEALPCEKNSLVSYFQQLGLPLTCALDSQALIHLHPNYSQSSRCLECALGFFIMKQSPYL